MNFDAAPKLQRQESDEAKRQRIDRKAEKAMM